MRTLVATLTLALAAAAGEDDSPSAFKFETDDTVKAIIKTKEIRKGVRKADPRDAIPAIRKPKIASAAEAKWVAANDRVLGIVVGKDARAYPLKILQIHEMVNDVLGGIPVAPNY